MTEPLREPLPPVLCCSQGLGRKPHGWRADVGGSAAGHHLSLTFFSTREVPTSPEEVSPPFH